MNKARIIEGLKIYAYLYLISAPFVYLLYKIAEIHPLDDFLILNIFISLSFWLYIKKVSPILSQKTDSIKTAVFLLLLITTTLFSIKSSSDASSVRTGYWSVESSFDSIQNDISDIKDRLGL